MARVDDRRAASHFYQTGEGSSGQTASESAARAGFGMAGREAAEPPKPHTAPPDAETYAPLHEAHQQAATAASPTQDLTAEEKQAAMFATIRAERKAKGSPSSPAKEAPERPTEGEKPTRPKPRDWTR